MSAKERVEDELIELDSRIMNLTGFINDDTSRFQYMSDYEKQLLVSQLTLMNGYSEILNKRLKIWQD